MDNEQLAKSEAQALKVFNPDRVPDILDEIAGHYHVAIAKVVKWFNERALAE